MHVSIFNYLHKLIIIIIVPIFKLCQFEIINFRFAPYPYISKSLEGVIIV